MVNTGSGDGLLPECTKPFPEPMSSEIHSRVMFTWILKTSIPNHVSYLHIWNQAMSSRGQFELITMYCRCLRTLNKLQGSTYPITLLPGARKTTSRLVDLSKDFLYNPNKYIEKECMILVVWQVKILDMLSPGLLMESKHIPEAQHTHFYLF